MQNNMHPLLANFLIGIGMRWNNHRLRKPLLHQTHNVESAQWALLLSILQKNSTTVFGREHQFATITNWQQYRDRVPVNTYDSLCPYIERQKQGEQALTVDPPIYYARTSGTTGSHKDLPMTQAGLHQVKIAQKQLALSLWKNTDWMNGSILGFASPAEEGRFDNGCPYGSVSGSTYQSMPAVLESKFVVPSSAFAVTDMQAKYQIYALAALACDDLTGIVSANPSSVLKLVELIQQQGLQFLKILDGEPYDSLHPEAGAFVAEIRKSASPVRIKSLLEIAIKEKDLSPKVLWPKLSALASWTGGSCGIALNQLMPHLPETTKVIECGYAASEFMGSVNIDPTNNHCIPFLSQHVFEFVERDDWENDLPHYLGAHELKAGREYYIFVTTQSGLYRYDINDIVRTGKKINACHAIEFLQKGRGVTNITGEKLSEYQLIAAVNQVMREHNLVTGYFMAIANPQTYTYTLYLATSETQNLEALADKIDSALCSLNIEYKDKRSSERLRKLTIKPLHSHAGDTIKAQCVASGVREAQYKPTILGYAEEWEHRLDPLVSKA